MGVGLFFIVRELVIEYSKGSGSIIILDTTKELDVDQG